MYTVTNYKTAKAVKEAFKAGEKIECYQPGGMFEGTKNGTAYSEGPHYPEPHRWYMAVELTDSIITKIK